MGKRITTGVLPGTADLVILRALLEGPLHGFGISRYLRRRSGGVVDLQDAALYQALHRLSRKGLLAAEWGLSDSKRRARFYALTPEGAKQLALEEKSFRDYVEGVFKILGSEPASA